MIAGRLIKYGRNSAATDEAQAWPKLKKESIMIALTRNFLLNAKKRTITVAPLSVMVNGKLIATSFVDFRDICMKIGLCSSDFENWPFIERISKEAMEDRQQYDRDRFAE